MHDAPAIAIHGLRVEFELERKRSIVALEDIDLDIAAGSFLSIIGPSGCGKSTLLRVIAGLTEPSAGSVRVGGGYAARARRAASLGDRFSR